MGFNLIDAAWRQRHVHGPDWRWQRAQARVDITPGHIDKADQHLRDAIFYLRQCAGGPKQSERAASQFPHIAAAERLALDLTLGAKLKVLVLGDSPPAEIAERLSLDVNVLSMWESLFFDARPARQATQWVLAKVIRPEEERGNGKLAAQLKVACAGGSAAAAMALDAFSRVLHRGGATLFDKKITLHAKFDEAERLLVNTNRERLFFIKLHAKLMREEQWLRLAERRLEQQSREALARQHSREERRLLQHRNEQARAAKAARKDEQRVRIESEVRARSYKERTEKMAQAKAHEERRQTARQHAATSALAQLRWQQTEAIADKPEPGRLDDQAQEEATVVSCLTGCHAGEGLEFSPREEGWAENSTHARENAVFVG